MRGSDEVDGSVDMSPMIDCCFLLLIFFVVNATAITVAKDQNVFMPSASASSDLTDAKGCIVVNIFKSSEKMTPKELENFTKSGYAPNILWSIPDSAGKMTGYTEAQEADLVDVIRQERERHEAAGIEKPMIRLYLRGDVNAQWDKTATVIRCGAAAGVTNIVFGALPTN